VEPCGGSLDVDGVKTMEIGLDDLRSNFSIIPQDPVLFTGTVRFNLDPFQRFSEDEVRGSDDRHNLSTSQSVGQMTATTCHPIIPLR
jgi:ABC-type transport system involved in cytochrome bd biosynthesis fused ATPase/permease subunit